MRKKVFFLIILMVPVIKAVEGDDVFSPQKIAREYREKGYLAQKEGDLKTAKAFYEKAISLDPSFAVAYNDLGIIYEAEGALNKAENNYLKAIELNPAYLSPYTNIALLCEKEKRWKEAKYFWKQRYLRDPRSSYWREEARKHIILLGGDEEVRESHLREEARELMADWEKKRKEPEDEFTRTIRNYFRGGFRSVSNN
ncbi:MAG: tetratricopeptide repeat protein [Candidatus Omnitrophica bacterium]|nr:tetratricopeptide repeat protein [Candidatus Omnitrophota bacterium]